MIIANRVTFHAVERYCHRILGVNCYPPAGTRPYDRAAMFCEAAGLTIEQVRALILTPVVESACRQGFNRIRADDFIAIICDGIIVTVKARMKPKPVRKSRREVSACL